MTAVKRAYRISTGAQKAVAGERRPERLEDLKRALAEDPDMLWARPVIALPDGTVMGLTAGMGLQRRTGRGPHVA